MFRFSSLLLLLALASAAVDSAPLDSDPLQSSRSRSSKTSEKALVVSTRYDGTICTGYGKKELPKDAKYVYIKVDGEKIKIELGTTNSTAGSNGWWANFKTEDAGDCAKQYTELVKPPDIGCNTVTDRSECCKYFDGRDFFLGQPCVPSKDGLTFGFDENVCEPACFVYGTTCEGSDKSDKIGSCAKCSKDSLEIGNADGSTNAADELNAEEGSYVKLYFKSKRSRSRRRKHKRGRSHSPEDEDDFEEEGEWEEELGDEVEIEEWDEDEELGDEVE